MKESLHRLLELQEIDKEILVLVRSKSDYPEEIAKLENDLNSGRSAIEETANRVEELESNRRHMESDLETIAHDLKKHQDRLGEVTTNKEYDAVQTEIETLTARKEEHETNIIQSIETLEDLNKKLEEDKEAFGSREGDIVGRIKELTKKLNSVESDIAKWDKKRAPIESGIDKPALASYNRIRRGIKDGIAAVPVRKGSCGGCYRKLSPQLLVEARRTQKVLICENCGRLIVWREEEEVPV